MFGINEQLSGKIYNCLVIGFSNNILFTCPVHSDHHFNIKFLFSEISNLVPSLEGKYFGVPLSNTLQYHIFLKEIFYSKQKISNSQKKLPNSGNHDCWLESRLTATSSKKVLFRGFVAIVSFFETGFVLFWQAHTFQSYDDPTHQFFALTKTFSCL